MLRLLSLLSFLICLFSIESKGDINKTLSRISVAHEPTVYLKDTTEDVIFFELVVNLTEKQLNRVQRFSLRHKDRVMVEDCYNGVMVIQTTSNRVGTRFLEVWNFEDGTQMVRMYKKQI